MEERFLFYDIKIFVLLNLSIYVFQAVNHEAKDHLFSHYWLVQSTEPSFEKR